MRPSTHALARGLLVTGCAASLAAAAACGTTPAASSPAASAPTPATTPAPTSPTVAAHPSDSTSTIAWKPCAGTKQRGFQCGSLEVPLDYADPSSGGSIDLALIRKPATDSAHRIGALVFDFGGPGDAGTQTLPDSAAEYRTLGRRYDLVSFDPRGVGHSAGIRCFTNAAANDKLRSMDSTPDDESEVRALTDERKAYLSACEAHSGQVLTHVGTTAAARDLDAIRSALGERTLQYLGISYGTWLGAAYAHQFPRRTGRLVLDSAVDPALSPEQLDLAQTASMQRAFDHFLTWCVAQGRSCPLTRDGRTTAALEAKVEGLLTDLDRHPLPTKDPKRPLTEALALDAIGGALGSQQLWPAIGVATTLAIHGQGDSLLQLSDSFAERTPQGSYPTLDDSNTAIRCNDTTAHYTVADIRRQLPAFVAKSKLFGPSQAWAGLRCLDWPSRGDDRTKSVAAPRSAPILVLAVTGDPNTPYAWGQRLVDELGNARLLTIEGEGHGGYGQGACVNGAVEAYLFTGKLPDRQSCKAS